jgi:hypothetical protein
MTQLRKRHESFLVGDLTWLGSKRGVDSAQTVTLDVSAFQAADLVTEGYYIKSGQPLKAATVDGTTKYVPYANTGTLAGFLLTDQFIDPRLDDTADTVAPMLDFGRIRTSKLPTTGFPASPTTSGQFVFVK